MAEELGVQVANLYAEGSSFASISKELAVSKSQVGDLLRNGIEILRNNNGVQEVGEQANILENDGLITPDPEGHSTSDLLWEKTLLIKATPILRKVVLNSKVFLQHEYFQKHLGYEKDVGDLLVEALNFYWKEMGFEIKIVHNSVM